MLMHPLERIPAERWSRVFASLVIATLAVMAVLRVMNAPLQNEAAPGGIVPFELAGGVEQATHILESWDATARIYAAFGLGLDFLFMVVYSTSIAMACLWAASVLGGVGGGLTGLGVWLAWGQWGAALLDAMENVALFVVLVGPVSSPWPQVAWGCATVKFALILMGLFYVMVAACIATVRRFTA
jgi:hypothetical protein